jgi:hypothetical protein
MDAEKLVKDITKKHLEIDVLNAKLENIIEEINSNIITIN